MNLIRRAYRKIFYTPEILVISYPKSGRTWLRVMLDYCNIQLRYYHQDSRLREGIPYYLMNNDLKKFSRDYVILLMRDPRDVLVSSYFHATRRMAGSYEGSISDFIRDESFGVLKIISFNKIWLDNREMFKKFMVVSYEELHQDAYQVLKRITEFAERRVDENCLRDAVEHGSFSNMRQMELTNSHKLGNRLEPGDVNDPESYKVRKGIVGGYAEYLSNEDIAYCEKIMEELNYPPDGIGRFE